MQKIYKKFKKFFCFVVLFYSFFLLTSCQSSDKTNSYLDVGNLTYTCEYNEVEDKTKITWSSSIDNQTIYNIKQIKVTFKAYNDSTYLGDCTRTYHPQIAKGKTYNGRFYFYVNQKVTEIEYDHWHADYESFFETYKTWIIATLIVVGILFVIYIIVMIVEGLDFGEIWESLIENWWVFWSIFLFLSSILVTIFILFWVQTLIILCGLLLLGLLIVIADFIKWIICEIIDNHYYSGNTLSEDTYQILSQIDECLNNKESLSLFKLEHLKVYCKENNISGYSKLNKSEVIDLIAAESNEGIPLSKNKPKQNHDITKQITFLDIAGLEQAKQIFKEKVILPFEHKDLYEKYNKKVGGGLLLYGLPGTGKTMFAEAASNEVKATFIPIKCSDIKSKWYGESENKVKNIFEQARKSNRAIIFFDEFETIGAKRIDSENANNDVVTQILVEMQGIGSSKETSTIMVIAATNKPWLIDSAFLRPGRFDEKIYIPLPDFQARKKLFQLKLKDIPKYELNYDYLAKMSEGFNGADITEFCEKLKMNAIRKSLKNKIDHFISSKDVEEILKIMHSSVSLEDIKKLEEFEKQF